MSIHICIYTGTLLGIFNFDLGFVYLGLFSFICFVCFSSFTIVFLLYLYGIVFLSHARLFLAEFLCAGFLYKFSFYCYANYLVTQFHLKLLYLVFKCCPIFMK